MEERAAAIEAEAKAREAEVKLAQVFLKYSIGHTVCSIKANLLSS